MLFQEFCYVFGEILVITQQVIVMLTNVVVDPVFLKLMMIYVRKLVKRPTSI